MSSARNRGAAVLGALVAGALRRVAAKATLRVVAYDPELETTNSVRALAARLLAGVRDGHVIVPFWSAHQVTMALLAAPRFGLRPALERFEVVADDSFGGRLMHALGRRMALTMRDIHARGNPSRLADIGAWLRAPAPFFIAVDGASTYGTVPTGIIRLAARLGSTIVPLAMRARPVLRLPGLVAEIPLPGATVALGVGAPLRVDRAAVVVSAAEELRERLERASAAAAACLRANPATSALWHPHERRRTA